MTRELSSEVGPRQITVRLCSGLGNQLFQFACGLAQSQRWKASLSFDTTWYTLVAQIHTPLRYLRLHQMGLPVKEAFKGWRRWVVGAAAAAFDRTGHGRSFLERTGKMAVIQETQPLRQQGWADQAPAKHSYLNGYWQTADHFLAVREELQMMIRPTAPILSAAKEWKSRVAERRTGFIHVRRGDYNSLVGEAGLLPLEYYKKAIQTFGSSEWHWLVFSEDEDWARHNMVFIPSWEVVNYDSKNRDIEDLMIMKECAAGIIANSSYSWWAAALGERIDRPIIAPDRYWKNADSSLLSWALPSWTQVRAWD